MVPKTGSSPSGRNPVVGTYRCARHPWLATSVLIPVFVKHENQRYTLVSKIGAEDRNRTGTVFWTEGF